MYYVGMYVYTRYVYTAYVYTMSISLQLDRTTQTDSTCYFSLRPVLLHRMTLNLQNKTTVTFLHLHTIAFNSSLIITRVIITGVWKSLDKHGNLLISFHF